MPLPLTDAEVLYPILPEARNNSLVFFDDSEIPREVLKTSSRWRQEAVTIEFRIKSEGFAAFYDFVRDATNKKTAFSLNIAGIQPFFRTAETNNVFIVGYSPPQRERSKHYRMSVTFFRDMA